MKATRQSLAAVALLAIAIAAGAYLRLESLGAPSYWLDEIARAAHGTSDAPAVVALDHRLLRRTWPALLPDQLTTHRTHSEFAGRLPAALLGIIAIALVWLAARSVKDIGWLAAPASAAFIALSPLHVYYSREARAYSLLMFLTAALIAALLRARTAVVPSIVLVALLYTTAAAAPLIGAEFVVTVVAAFLSKGPARRRFATIAVASAATLACMPLLYASRPVEDASWPGFPDVGWQFVFGIVRSFRHGVDARCGNGGDSHAAGGHRRRGRGVARGGHRSNFIGMTVLRWRSHWSISASSIISTRCGTSSRRRWFHDPGWRRGTATAAGFARAFRASRWTEMARCCWWSSSLRVRDADVAAPGARHSEARLARDRTDAEDSVQSGDVILAAEPCSEARSAITWARLPA